ncbi:hypothetical protein [Pseudolactococcus raffinolactis]|uniref:hypothetical protein n=1 Tax=Pseudolactococcus raffinolactis TaxID=1366 RepID=UPI001436A644|nr:hypothetical protein [Lactococcus raffinolactis]QIW51771.1 hypothetical protein GU337_07720 [Lactococcus raffinolactis]
MTQFEVSQHAKLLANNEGQSREIKRLQVEAKHMRLAFRDLDLYCGQLEAENERLKAKLARYEMLETATKVWGY